MKFQLYFAKPQIPDIYINNFIPDVFYNDILLENKLEQIVYETNDAPPSEDINDYLLNSIDFRLNNLKNNRNQKISDMITILKIYKNYINDDDNENEINFIKYSIIKKTDNINKRIKNNYTKLFKLFDDYRYYKNHISDEIKQKGKTKKLIKVKEKIHDYFINEIESTEKRIEFLSNKLSILKYHDKNLSNDENYIRQFVTDFIDKNLNTNGNIRDILNEILLYSYRNNGAYYDGIKIIKKDKICQNTKTICDINALIYG